MVVVGPHHRHLIDGRLCRRCEARQMPLSVQSVSRPQDALSVIHDSYSYVQYHHDTHDGPAERH